MNQMEFEKKFSDEAKCFQYLVNLKWPEGYVCILCKNREYWITKRKKLVCKGCGHQISPTVGTIFHKAKKPLFVYFRAIWWIVAQKTGVSATGLQRILGLGSYHTAWEWLHKFRRLMVIPGREKLSGVVEVDETFIGGHRSGKRGRGAEGKTLIVIAVEIHENGTGRVRMAIIPNASYKSLKTFITENVEKSSEIQSDGWKSYLSLKKDGYLHTVITTETAEDKENLTPNVHRVASLLKRWLLGTHQSFVKRSHLEYYLDEFTFRHNRRKAKSRGLLFEIIMKQAVAHKPIHKAELKA